MFIFRLINSSVADDLPYIFQISYLWYTLIGLTVSCVVGLLTSFIGLGGGSLDPRDIDPALLAPVVRGLIKPRNFPNQPPTTDQIILAYEAVGISNTDTILKERQKWHFFMQRFRKWKWILALDKIFRKLILHFF